MKKLSIILFVAIIALNTKTVSANQITSAATSSVLVSHSDKENRLTKEEVNRMINRLKEMRAMDASTLTSAQKHELRKEVLSIKAKLMYPAYGGVYISAGALLLIIILLIIFL